MLNKIEVLGHSTIKLKKNSKIIYIDPYNINNSINDADIIFITHSHYDHFSQEDIKKVRNNNTIIIITEDLYNDTIQLNFKENNIITVKPGNNYQVNEIKFCTIPAYNVNKKFHPKDNNWVGYIIELEGNKYYIAGDTDITEENKKIKCDVAFVPVGGTYTMNYKEAAKLINEIKPKLAIPVHYGSIVGTKKDAEEFVKLLVRDVEGKILIH